MLLSIPFPLIDPVAVDLGVLSIRWYSLAYIFTILISFYFAKKIVSNKKSPAYRLNKVIWDFMSYLILGVIIGGRLGQVIFYDPIFYLLNPLEIFAIWKGGMSFHGGLIGVMVATYIFTKKHNVKFFALIDIISLFAPIGLFLGRITNFINDELYGTVTNVAWAVNFPSGGYLPRHPVQLYESFLEGFVLFIILFFCYRKFNYKIGFTSGVFAVFYSIFRFFAENFREEETPLPDFINFVTLGQLLCLPMFFIGAYIIYNANKKYQKIG